MKPIVRNIQNGDFYSWDGERFENVRTGQSGVVDDETARKVFRFNPAATELFNEYPILGEFVKRLNLKADEVVGL